MNKITFFRKSVSIFFVFSIIIGSASFASVAHAARGDSWRTYNTRYQERESTRYQSSNPVYSQINALQSESTVVNLKIPILFGVALSNLEDTWGDARSDGRTHEGIDIMAPKGSLVVSPTKAIVTTISSGGNGGNYVFTANPGGERFYFAHLDKFAENLKEGQVLEPGDLIGYVGNTGNAAGGPTHLHFGIYQGRYGDQEGNNTTNPFPRLTLEFSIKEKVDAFTKIINQVSGNAEELARTNVTLYRSVFMAGPANGVTAVPVVVARILSEQTPTAASVSSLRTLRSGSRGDDVRWLQEALIKANKGPLARALAQDGVDGVFGGFTTNALIEYQKASGLSSDGVLGPRSRASLALVYPY
ncbi:MAG: peptidoglycan DD-metalloendopeptidase family protein [Patescibacteria group bacterium]